MNETIKAPWLAHYGEVPHTLEYPDISMIALVREAAEKYPNGIAFSFMGKHTPYPVFLQMVDDCARSLAALGIREGSRVMICMPNVPQAVACFYAVNVLGAVAVMVHPLSSEGELDFYVRTSGVKAIITLDQFYGKFEAIGNNLDLPTLVIAKVQDALGLVKKLGYAVTQGRKVPKVPSRYGVLSWEDFLRGGRAFRGDYAFEGHGDTPAVILYSGGTTGTTKGILLTNLNFNALALQTAAMGHCIIPGKAMLSVMPIFHGFGLGVCIHTMLANNVRCILVPRFNAESYAGLLKKEKPNYIAGVPTLFEALLRGDSLKGADLSCLLGVFSGGDSLSIELKKKFDKFLFEHGSTVRIREGYGTTECVTASCLTPYNIEKEGSIGLPFPDTFYKIVKVGSTKEQPYGEEGEICISGPSVMREYVDKPDETAQTLRQHEDGRVWLHTGDIGSMDAEGFVYFRQRLKRMIISSGYNIYPSQLENVIDAHPDVKMSCVIGIPDSYKMQRPKAFIVLRDGVEDTPEVRRSIIEHCRKNIAKYAMFKDYEIRSDLPKTLVGKIAYTKLEAEEAARAVEAAAEAAKAEEAEKSES